MKVRNKKDITLANDMREFSDEYAIRFGIRFDSHRNIEHYSDWMKQKLYLKYLGESYLNDDEKEASNSKTRSMQCQKDYQFLSKYYECDVKSGMSEITARSIRSVVNSVESEIRSRFDEKVDTVIRSAIETCYAFDDVDIADEHSVSAFCSLLETFINVCRHEHFD